jgi:16S rRNA (adenine1518-N6/adenine1519-N6)-dimethyltransferase
MGFLEKQNIRPTKNRGQNFLMDRNHLKKIAAVIPDSPEMLEIGPGLGHLTRYLMDKTRDLTVVELDRGFVEVLKKTLPPEVNIVHEDFLKYDLSDGEKVVVGNIPYYITSKIITHILKSISFVREFDLLMEREMGEKLLCGPGDANYGRIAVLVQHYTRAEIALKVPPTAFYPKPKVESVFVTFRPVRKEWDQGFFDFLTKIFSARRKTLASLLKKNVSFEKAEAVMKSLNLKDDLRAETLRPEGLFEVYERVREDSE